MVSRAERGVAVEELEVECVADERGEWIPRRLGRSGEAREIVDVLDRWPGAGHCYYRVRDDAGALWILRRDDLRGTWWVVAFEQAASPPRPSG
jgi:hypothetical protein